MVVLPSINCFSKFLSGFLGKSNLIDLMCLSLHSDVHGEPKDVWNPFNSFLKLTYFIILIAMDDEFSSQFFPCFIHRKDYFSMCHYLNVSFVN